jgi:hypothetical protein
MSISEAFASAIASDDGVFFTPKSLVKIKQLIKEVIKFRL